jgi:oligopeptide transport system substrate-binding protein
MKVRRLVAWTALPVALAVGVTACGAGKSGSDGAGGNGPVSIGIADPEHLVPTNTVENNGFQVISALWTPLVSYDSSGRPQPDAAESIDTSDNRVWTVKLKDGYTFHNGQKVTADSYIRAWNYGAYGPNAQVGTDFFSRIQGYDAMQSPDGRTKPAARTLAGLKKVNATTFTITLSKPFAEWEKVLGYNTFYPLPNAAFAPDGTLKKDFESAPIGDGPFKMKGTWDHSRGISVERYDAYPGEPARIKAVDFKIYQDQTTMYNDLVAGNLDVAPQFPSSVLANARTDLGDRMKKTSSSYFAFLTVPAYDKDFANTDVRKAISMAINRPEIIDKIFVGTYKPASSWVSPIVEGARSDTCGEACSYDPARAKQLFAQGGGKPGMKLPLYYNTDGGHKEWVDAVCNQLNQNLGVDCVGTPVTQLADLRKQARAHALNGLVRGAWSFDYPSIEDYLTPLFKTGGSSNDSQYSSKAFDRAVEAGDAARNPSDSIAAYQKAEDIVAHDMPVIPLWFRQNIYGYSTRMQTVDMDLFANVDVATLQTK